MLIIMTRSLPAAPCRRRNHSSRKLSIRGYRPFCGGSQMATTQSGALPLSDEDSRRQLRRAVIASTVGTTIDWYDFFLYSIVTGLLFAKLSFPASYPLVRTLQPFL